MKTNLTNLMQLLTVLQEQKKIYSSLISSSAQNTYIIELDGKEQEMEVNKDFDENVKKYYSIIINIEKIKNKIDERNNVIKINEEMTIKQALNHINTLRDKQSILNNLLTQKDSKRRISETTNSYFISKVSNFDREIIKNKKENIDIEIQKIQNEIGKANSQEFEIDINLGS